jgi:hypothetical protein
MEIFRNFILSSDANWMPFRCLEYTQPAAFYKNNLTFTEIYFVMANIFSVNVYQINQRVLDRDSPKKMGFPTTGLVIIEDVSNSPTRSLPSGYNVYGLIIVPSSAAANSQGTFYYVAETYAQLVTMIG